MGPGWSSATSAPTSSRTYNKDEAWEGRSDAFTRASDYIATLIGARAGAAVIPLRG